VGRTARPDRVVPAVSAESASPAGSSSLVFSVEMCAGGDAGGPSASREAGIAGALLPIETLGNITTTRRGRAAATGRGAGTTAVRGRLANIFWMLGAVEEEAGRLFAAFGGVPNKWLRGEILR
jgi:hypothetical protein